MAEAPSPLAAKLFGAADLSAAVLVLVGVFMGLPSRWMPVDAGAVVLALLLGAAGFGLVTKAPWAKDVARIASCVVLAVGLLLIAALALTASYLSGVYGPIGKGGALILILVAALALPYLVVLPGVQLLWIGPWKRKRAEAPAKVTVTEAASP